MFMRRKLKMTKVYVLMCEVWGGTNYSTIVQEVFKDEEFARRTALCWQGNHKTCDVRYYVEAVDYNELEV